MTVSQTVFIGGGNMARAIVGGLLAAGRAASSLLVVEPQASTREALARDLGVTVQERLRVPVPADACVVWAVKPQVLGAVMRELAPQLPGCLHLSIAAGVPVASMRQWLGTARLVRAMPNTPALVGKGITGLYAGEAVAAADRAAAQHIAEAVGQVEWVAREELLNAVTAVSGSGPAYVFYLLEAMRQAGTELGLPPDQAYRLAVATVEGAAALAAASSDGPEVLRQRVTSKGGTTFAAIARLDEAQVQAHLIEAMRACHDRAVEMAREMG